MNIKRIGGSQAGGWYWLPGSNTSGGGVANRGKKAAQRQNSIRYSLTESKLGQQAAAATLHGHGGAELGWARSRRAGRGTAHPVPACLLPRSSLATALNHVSWWGGSWVVRQ